MSDLNIKSITEEQARELEGFNISLKRDGTLIYFIDGKLFSKRCERSDRYKHILDILIKNNFPNCYGELYIEDGNVFDISKKENWDKAKFMPIDLLNSDMNYKDRIDYLYNKIVNEVKSKYITFMVYFMDFKEGWEYVKANNQEGLVLRNENDWYKVKILQELKIPIKEHEKGKDKGTFILEDGNRVSGTSTEFVVQYLDIKNKGNTPIAEIEFPFKTKDGHYFQPRLRRIFEK